MKDALFMFPSWSLGTSDRLLINLKLADQTVQLFSQAAQFSSACLDLGTGGGHLLGPFIDLDHVRGNKICRL